MSSPSARDYGFADAVLEASADGIIVVDGNGGIVRCNPAATRILGRPESELLGEAFGLPAGLPADPGRLGNAPERSELRIIRPDGSTRIVESSTSGTAWENEPVTVVTLRDITDRLHVEAEQHRLLAIIDATPNVVAVADPEERLRFLNRAGRRTMGLDDEAPVQGHTLLELAPERIRDRLRGTAIPEALESGSWEGESAMRSPTGEELPVWQVLIAHRSYSGEVEFLSTVLQDLSRQKRAEAALRERAKELGALYSITQELARSNLPLEERLARTVTLIPEGWSYPDATEARLTCFGRSYSTSRFVATSWSMSHEIRAQDRIVGTVEVALREERPNRFGGDGPFLEEEEELLHAVARAVGDAAERDALQRDFVHAQKMETIGRLAGGVAHDFNNLLTVIQGQARALLGALPQDSPLRDEVREILGAGERGGDLTQRLLAFSRKQVLAQEVFSVGRTVKALRPMLRRLIPERVQLAFELHSSGGSLDTLTRGDRRKLEQVLLNLALNAAQAIQGAGRVTFRVERREVPEGGVADLPERIEPGDYVHLTVVDTGEGMPEHVRQRAFEPFFTTKPEGDGTGLGLSMVFGIVKQSGGQLALESVPGEGTAVHLFLPRTDEPPADDTPADLHHGEATPAPKAEADAVILLVEDDEAVRKVAKRMLEPLGPQVVTATNAEEALELARAHGSRIEVVVSDVIMPGMGGPQLVERLREEMNDVKVVLMSGYSEEELPSDGMDDNVQFVKKPFAPDVLQEAVRRLLV